MCPYCYLVAYYRLCDLRPTLGYRIYALITYVKYLPTLGELVAIPLLNEGFLIACHCFVLCLSKIAMKLA